VSASTDLRAAAGYAAGAAGLWPELQILHLAALAALAQERSFVHAAARLGYTPSAIGQQIASLERVVGQRLVERPGGPKPVSLTSAGSLLHEHASMVLTRLAAARADLAAPPQARPARRASADGESGSRLNM